MERTVGVLERVFLGDAKCTRNVVADNQQVGTLTSEPSLLCHVVVGVLVVRCALSLRNTLPLSKKSFRHGAYAVLQVALTFAMYNHCVKCQAWSGFFKTLMLTIVGGIVIDAIWPSEGGHAVESLKEGMQALVRNARRQAKGARSE